jgi:hypothetical protein
MAILVDRKKRGAGKLDVEDAELYDQLYPPREFEYSGPNVDVQVNPKELEQIKKLIKENPDGDDLTPKNVYTRIRNPPNATAVGRKSLSDVELGGLYPAKIVIRDERGVWCDIGAEYLAWMPVQEIIDQTFFEFFNWNRYVRVGDVFAATVTAVDEWVGEVYLAPWEGDVPSDVHATLRQMRDTDEHKLNYWPYTNSEYMDLTGIFPLSNPGKVEDYLHKASIEQRYTNKAGLLIGGELLPNQTKRSGKGLLIDLLENKDKLDAKQRKALDTIFTNLNETEIDGLSEVIENSGSGWVDIFFEELRRGANGETTRNEYVAVDNLLSSMKAGDFPSDAFKDLVEWTRGWDFGGEKLDPR